MQFLFITLDIHNPCGIAYTRRFNINNSIINRLYMYNVARYQQQLYMYSVAQYRLYMYSVAQYQQQFRQQYQQTTAYTCTVWTNINKQPPIHVQCGPISTNNRLYMYSVAQYQLTTAYTCTVWTNIKNNRLYMYSVDQYKNNRLYMYSVAQYQQTTAYTCTVWTNINKQPPIHVQCVPISNTTAYTCTVWPNIKYNRLYMYSVAQYQQPPIHVQCGPISYINRIVNHLCIWYSLFSVVSILEWPHTPECKSTTLQISLHTIQEFVG